jgi:hypothetical protein
MMGERIQRKDAKMQRSKGNCCGERPRPAGRFGRPAQTYVQPFLFEAARREISSTKFLAGRQKLPASGVRSPRLCAFTLLL